MILEIFSNVSDSVNLRKWEMHLKPRAEVWLRFGSASAHGCRGANLLLPLQQCHVCLLSLFSPFFSSSCCSARPAWPRCCAACCGWRCLGRGLGWVTPRGPCQPQPCCDSVKTAPLVTVWDALGGSHTGGLRQQPRAATLGALPFLCLGRRTGPKAAAAGAAARLRQICSLTALAGSAPTASAHWRYRWVLIMPSALVAIQMLKLFICSWVSSRQRQQSERVPSAAADLLPRSPPRDGAPQGQAGTAPAAPSVRGRPAAPQPRPTAFRPVFLGKWVPSAWPRKRGGEDSAYFTLCWFPAVINPSPSAAGSGVGLITCG